MDPLEGSWMQSPSGSRAVEAANVYEENAWPQCDDEGIEWARFQGGANFMDDGVLMPEDDAWALAGGDTLGSSELRHGEIMNSKIPPAFDGRVSWFKFEEFVGDWVDCCVLNKDKQGPALKNRLYGDAEVYKSHLDRNLLIKDDGVEYFLNKLRPEFINGVQNVFLYRLFVFFVSVLGYCFSLFLISSLKDTLIW